MDFIVHKRLRDLTYEILILGNEKCLLSFEEKMKKIFAEIADPFIRHYSQIVGREREYESRILNGTKNLIEKMHEWSLVPPEIKTLLNYLPDNYQDNIKREMINEIEIHEAVYSSFNPDKIGLVYYSTNW